MDFNHRNYSIERRQLIKGLSLGFGTTVFGPPFSTFNELKAAHQRNPLTSGGKHDKKLGIALVGLGQYSAGQLAPALKETKHCYSKIEPWKQEYNIPDKNVYSYDDFDKIAGNPDIDIVYIVYIVLPVSLHAEYTIRAAKAKKHVICEKPMALNVEEAQRMLNACNENGVQLAIGYRLHNEPFNKRVMELGQKQVFGKVKSIEAKNTSDMTQGPPDLWRLRKGMAGGGPLMDMGIYCVQGVCYTLGKNPVAVRAKFGEITNPTYFYEVEESISWQMEFEDGTQAECYSSYSDPENSLLSAEAENGWWKLQPAYQYEDKEGETQEGKMDLPNIYEQVMQLDEQAQSFRNNEKSKTPGEMGIRDMKILMAIYESANNGGKKVDLSL